MSDHILVIDEGTTSTRAMLFSVDGTCLGSCQKPITQHYPAPGLVEHDAAEIWALTLACAQEMVVKAGGADRIAGIGITNQRETGGRASHSPLRSSGRTGAPRRFARN
jgi:glycerol kinase